MYNEPTAPAANNQNTFTFLRISLGIVYLWFGALKFFAGLSPAEQLATNTIHRLTFGLISDHTNLTLLAAWECFIGVMFIAGKLLKPMLVLMLLQMAFTFTPFLFFPQQTFNFMPYGLTLVGQYIIKNIVFIAAGFVLWKNANAVPASNKEQAIPAQHKFIQATTFEA